MNVLTCLHSELLAIIVSFLTLSSRFSLKRVIKYFFRHNISALGKLDATKVEIITDAIDHPVIFKWLIPNPACLSRYRKNLFAKEAVIKGSIEIVRYMPDNIWNDEYDININMCETAAIHGHFDILKWLKKKGCQLTVLTYRAAVRKGDIEILKWLYENKCPLDPHASLYAVIDGHLHIIMYFYENGYFLDTCIWQYATRNGHLHILKYLYEIGWPMSYDQIYSIAKDLGHHEIMNWLEELDVLNK